ncbi:hypothetical protein I6H46_06330 [Anaerococcus obesiensis]|uniref:Condensation domain-containing protein n=1 Tax=Anaerococcus obesiensis TaxID=1287640 RepID=A0A7T7USX5_9FIRM|nr:hypothetical protein [Anaerococcus obesiensis]QQN55529.1 hypothetical protein I6H46_06330 [Anaerococcus obesiensis]
MNLRIYKELAFNKRLLDEAEKYWNKMIKTLPKAPNLRTKMPINDLEEYNFKRKEYRFSKEQTDNLIHYSKLRGVTLSAILITIYMKVLSDLIETDELTITTTLFGKLPVVKMQMNCWENLQI